MVDELKIEVQNSGSAVITGPGAWENEKMNRKEQTTSAHKKKIK